MKLNKVLREHIVKSIIADIPNVDYREQMRVFMQKEAKDQWPQELKDAVSANHFIEGYLETVYKLPFSCIGHVSVLNNNYHPDTSNGSELKRMHGAHELQTDSINSISSKIKSVINDCKTTEEFISVFPEFLQYMPSSEKKLSNLPACKVVEEMKAAGWNPKNGEQK